MNSYFCDSIYRICNPTYSNMFMTLGAQLSANTMAQMPLYQVPSFNYSSMMGMSYNNMNFNTIFNNIMQSTMQQFDWQMKNGGTWNCGNSFTSWWQNSTNTNNNDDDDSSETEADKKAEKTAKIQYDKLALLINLYKNTHDGISDSLKTDIKTALTKDSDDTYVQAYDKLKKVYKQINSQDSDGLKETLTLLNEEIQDDDGDVITHKYQDDLVKGGYDYSSMSGIDGVPEADFQLSTIEKGLEKADPKGYQYAEAEDLYGSIALDQENADNNVLEFLSAWNNKYSKVDGKNTRSVIRMAVNKIIDKELKYKDGQCEEYINNNIINVANGLMYKGNYDASHLKHISKSEKSLLKKLSDNIDTDITKINALKDGKGEDKDTSEHLATRLNKLVKDFEKLYVALRLAEAKNSQAIIKADYEFLNDISDDDEDIITEDLIVANTLQDLKDEGFTESEINSCGVVADVEDRDDDNTEVKEDGDNTTGTEDDETVSSMITNGTEVRKLLRGWTSKKDSSKVNEYLDSINSDNVLDFLKGYYSDGKDRVEGLIEHLDDDNAGNNITMDNKKNLIYSILEKAKKLGLENSEEYKEIETIMSIYEDSDDVEFNRTHRDVKGFHTWFDRITDNEVLDDNIEKLYKKMLTKEGTTTVTTASIDVEA